MFQLLIALQNPQARQILVWHDKDQIMKVLIPVLIIIAIGASTGESFSEKGTFVDSVKFIQYLDENTALEEVRNGNIDIYYYRIPSDRLEEQQSREGLQVFDSSGGSYSILVNPAESEKFNPFAAKDARFALNYLVDRKLIVNELMGGFGSAISSYYAPSDPEFLTVIEVLEQFNFGYNPVLAEEIITKSISDRGAVKIDGMWEVDSEPVTISIFIRSDDPVRKSIGELLSSELKDMGFVVKKDFGDLNKAFVVVYGSDPADAKWNIYTEGWGRSAFVRYDSAGLGQMYAPWFSNMPGFNDPGYWNYENEKIDTLTQQIYTGDFESSEERYGLVRDALYEGVSESVRIFLASKTDRYVANTEISGIVNGFGAGVPSRFTPINAQSTDGDLTVGVKQIYQGSWNPVMGLTDSYSNHIWGIISDPGTFKHPFTGETIPVRADWSVETAGPDGKMVVPSDAIMWSPQMQAWDTVGNTTATSKVTFDYEFGSWHHGGTMDMNDIMYSLYFVVEWGTQTDENDRTFDAEFTPRAAQSIQTIKGVNQIDEDTLEVYVDYWHFDDGEIAEWASVWSSVPWEITAAMEQTVLDGKSSFSRSGATGKNISWLSLLIPSDASHIKDSLDRFAESRHVPDALVDINTEYLQDRYAASSEWIIKNNHAVISNGPFYLESYSPEARTIHVRSFAEAYPFDAGRWSQFEDPDFPSIDDIEIDDIIRQGEESNIIIKTSNADAILYFLIGSDGKLVASDTISVDEEKTVINITSEETRIIETGAGSAKIFAISDSVLRPDFYETGFILAPAGAKMPDVETVAQTKQDMEYSYLVAIPVVLILVVVGVWFRSRKSILAHN